MEGLTLDLILTPGGVTISAAVIATIIELAKRFGGFGVWLDAGREASASIVLSLLLTAYAYLATVPAIDPTSAFNAFLAFLGIAAIAAKAYDVVLKPLTDTGRADPPGTATLSRR